MSDPKQMSRLPSRLLTATGSILVLAALPAAVNVGLLGGLLGASNTESTNTSSHAEQRATGFFNPPFDEPLIYSDGQVIETDEKCITRDYGMDECKPSAGTIALLKDGRLLYVNAL